MALWGLTHSSSQEETEKTAPRCLSGEALCFFSYSAKGRKWGSRGSHGVSGTALLKEGQSFVSFTASEGTEKGKETEWASPQKAAFLWCISFNLSIFIQVTKIIKWLVYWILPQNLIMKIFKCTWRLKKWNSHHSYIQYLNFPIIILLDLFHV